MPEFLLELYISRADAASVDRGASRARRAAQQLAGEGRSIRHLRSIYIPAEETCFHLWEATSVTDVEAAADRAGLSRERIVEAVTPAIAAPD
jgi:hypothetical protein